MAARTIEDLRENVPQPVQQVLGDIQIIAEKVKFVEDTAPANPVSGEAILYVDAAGDLIVKINHGGTTKTVTLVDYSAV